MTVTDRIVVACSCEGTMPLATDAIAAGTGARVEACTQACRSELDRVRRLLGTGAPLTIGCTQEAPLFTEVAEELDAEDRVIFANIRENAGWSNEAALAAP